MILDARPNCGLTFFLSILVSNLFRKEHTIIYHIFVEYIVIVFRDKSLCSALRGAFFAQYASFASAFENN